MRNLSVLFKELKVDREGCRYSTPYCPLPCGPTSDSVSADSILLSKGEDEVFHHTMRERGDIVLILPEECEWLRIWIM